MVRIKPLVLSLLLLLPVCAPAQNTRKQESRKAALQPVYIFGIQPPVFINSAIKFIKREIDWR